jgi:hypothetical protein
VVRDANRTRFPLNRKFVKRILPLGAMWLALLGALSSSTAAKAATLKPETLKDWEAYTQAARAQMRERLSPRSRFLMVADKQERAQRVRSGEVVTFPMSQTPRKISDGLIHDWVGAIFIPNTKLDEVLATVRDYEHYKDFYHPAVMDSKVGENAEAKDRFSIVLVNKPIISKTAFDGDYESSYVRVDESRWYSISETTRMQEVEGYGTAEQRTLSENEGSGLIWRLLSITRFEQADGGVYVELQAIALSRDIPASLRWIVNPIIRRVSRNSLLISLQQTSAAVNSRSVVIARNKSGERPAGVSTGRVELKSGVSSFR